MDKKENPSAACAARWVYLLAGTVSMLFAGIIYAWSILKAPLAEAFGWTPSGLGLNFTLTMCFFCIGGVVSGYLTRRTSPKVPVIAGALLFFFGFMIVSRMSGGGIALLYLSYGGMGGFGIGMAYNAVISTTSAWFPDKRGMCSGFLMMGFGLSALLLGNLAGRMIGAGSVGWRNTYFILGAAIGAVLLLTGLMIRLPPSGMRFPQPKAARKAEPEENFERKDYTTAEMVRRATFWKFFLFCITTSAVGSTVISFARDLTMSVGAAATLATALVGVLSVCNGLGRIFAGFLFDALGRRRTMLATSAITILAAAVLLVSVLNRSLALGIAGICLTGVSYGCSPTITPAFVGTFYGMKHLAVNFSVANLMLIPASFTATLAGSLVASTGSYVLPCAVLLVFSVVSLLLCLGIKRP
ncbi:MFS transporter [Caproiciproducens sp. NJN-50]|uniref:MFS transporter n=1 Tax=Acutalibacteraceae TaxID=3082771 RepID=UPI000FFE2CC0|nr:MULTISPECIES: MFS transporter [Acutalibacteraceae]QAT48656.1 MFS transporter [Caproiciproducens sp. NJN-50]